MDQARGAWIEYQGGPVDDVRASSKTGTCSVEYSVILAALSSILTCYPNRPFACSSSPRSRPVMRLEYT